jgi:hypothetical protein
VAQTQHIKSARKTKDGDRPTCHTCHKPIEVGQGYYKNSPSRFSATYSWHEGCPGPRASTLESNEKRGAAYAACEDADDAVEAIDGVLDIRDGGEPVEVTIEARVKYVMECLGDAFTVLGDGIQEAAEMWRESASNIEEGFGHETERSQEMNDHADVYDDAASEASDNLLDQITEWDPDAEMDFDEWLDQAKAEAHDAIDGVYGMID